MQRRSQIGVFWIAVTLMASLVPCLPIAICIIDLSSFFFVADVPVQALQSVAIVRNDQPLSLLSVALFRGPPSLGSIV